MDKVKKFFADITKVQEEDDGTIIVEGFASSDDEDSDGEVVTSAAMKAALPDYMQWGNVREMHQAKAAGVALDAMVDDDGRTLLRAHIVDSDAVRKVKKKVYKGFSIGARVTSRDEANKMMITGISLREISLVDRPANPKAVISCYKADGDVEPDEGITDTEDMDADEVVVVKGGDEGDIETAPADDVDDDAKENEGEDDDGEADEVELDTDTPVEPEPEPAAEPEDVAAVTAETADASDATAEVAEPVTEGADVPSEKADKAETVEAQADDASEADDVQKGMGSIRHFSGVLEFIADFTRECEDEAEWMEENTTIPAQLSEWLKQGVAIFKAMSAEEADKLVADMSVKAEAAPVSLRRARDEINKAVEQLKALVPVPPAPAEPSEALEAINKVAASAGCDDEAETAEFIEKLASERDELRKRVKELEKQPAPAKGGLRSVTKGDDAIEPETAYKDIEPVRDASGQVNDVATLIKSIRANGKI